MSDAVLIEVTDEYIPGSFYSFPFLIERDPCSTLTSINSVLLKTILLSNLVFLYRGKL